MTGTGSGLEIEVFFSYSHRDEELMQELVKHLSILKRQEVIRDWHDRQIGGGQEWAGEIDKHLNSAQVILLLISSDFLASDYCYDIEMKRAMERHEAGEARVVPIILRPVDWKESPFSKLQGFPKDGKPVTSWANRDEAFLDIARGIRAVVEQLQGMKEPVEVTGKDRLMLCDLSVGLSPFDDISDPFDQQPKQAELEDPLLSLSDISSMSQSNHDESTGYQTFPKESTVFVGGVHHHHNQPPRH